MRITVHYFLTVALYWPMVYCGAIGLASEFLCSKARQYIYMPSRVQLIQQVNGICVTGVVSHASPAPKGL